MHYYLKSFFIIKSSSGPCHEDPGDPVSFTGFSVVNYPHPQPIPIKHTLNPIHK